MVKYYVLASAVALISTTAAQASTVSGQFSGTIAAPTTTTSPGMVHSGDGQSVFRWGTPSGPATEVEVGNSASLAVSTTSFSHDVLRNGDFQLGTITWDNQSNWYPGGTWSSVMTLNLDFDTPNDLAPISHDLKFSSVNTTDSYANTDRNEQTGNNPDDLGGIVLSSSAFNVPLDLGEGLTLESVFFQLDDAGTPGTPWNGTGPFLSFNGAASQYDPATGLWRMREGGTAVIGVYGTISTVPLPAGMWLLLAGLGGIATFGRRARNQA